MGLLVGSWRMGATSAGSQQARTIHGVALGRASTTSCCPTIVGPGRRQWLSQRHSSFAERWRFSLIGRKSGTIAGIRMLKLPSEPPHDSPNTAGPVLQPAQIEAPETTADLTDGRPLWDWRSKYTAGAWVSIGLEGSYLVLVLALALTGLFHVACAFAPIGTAPLSIALWFAGVPQGMHIWMSVALGGACGGCAFALKWLYHGVAYGKWHRDRLVWRLVVPVLAAVLALFTALMVASGIVPIFNSTVFDGPTVGAAFGFFVGFFSDNLLAGLQRLATELLGTLEKPERKK